MIHKRTFLGIKSTGKRQHKKADYFEMEDGTILGRPVLCFEDDKGRDWYDLREDEKWGWVIATWPDGHIGAYMKATDFIPCEGQRVYEVNPKDMPTTVLMDLYGTWGYDGEKFFKLALS